MNFWEEIRYNLWNEGFDVLNENDVIEWKSENAFHSINYENIAIDNNNLAWYQNEEYGRCWVKIKHPDGFILNWRLLSNHPDWGYRFKYIKWHNNQLIIIYGEKHRDYIIKIKDLKVETLYNDRITEIQFFDNSIFVKSFSEIVQVINLNSETTEIKEVSHNVFKTTYPNVELKPESSYFLLLDKNYNKNFG